jgi:hypothetical protein
MAHLEKGMIRWWKHRVMDYERDNEGKWDNGGYNPWRFPNDSLEQRAEWEKYKAARKFIPDPYEDKPYAQKFTAIMKLQGFYRGRSAAGFTFIDESGREHTMRIKCVTDLLLNATLVRGVVSGTWAYSKQGSNFSLKYLGDIEA